MPTKHTDYADGSLQGGHNLGFIGAVVPLRQL